MKLTPSLLENATGLVRNTKIYKAIDRLINTFDADRQERKVQEEAQRNILMDMKEAVKEAHEEKAIENVNLTFTNLTKNIDEKFKSHSVTSEEKLDTSVQEFKGLIRNDNCNNNVLTSGGNGYNTNVQSTITYKTYSHSH